MWQKQWKHKIRPDCYKYINMIYDFATFSIHFLNLYSKTYYFMTLYSDEWIDFFRLSYVRMSVKMQIELILSGEIKILVNSRSLNVTSGIRVYDFPLRGHKMPFVPDISLFCLFVKEGFLPMESLVPCSSNSINSKIPAFEAKKERRKISLKNEE